MNLLDQMNAIDIGKVADEEVAESIQKAIANYDERVPKTITVAEMILEMVRDNFPNSIKMHKMDMSEVGEYIEPEEAETELKKGKPIVAETAGGDTYSVTDKKEIREAVKKDHELKVKEPDNEAKDNESEAEARSKSSKKKITPENKGECEIIISEIKNVLSKYQSKKTKTPKEKPKKKPLAVLVKDSMVSIIKKVIVKEKRRTKKDIDPKKFDPVIAKGKDFLKALRKASGGISDNNDQMIESFENQMNEILETLKK